MSALDLRPRAGVVSPTEFSDVLGDPERADAVDAVDVVDGRAVHDQMSRSRSARIDAVGHAGSVREDFRPDTQ